jgi:hypothetical protein
MKITTYIIALTLIISACSDDNCNCPTSYNNYSNFKITSKSYSEKNDLDSAVLTDYGEEYRMADWQDLLKIISIAEFSDEVGIKNGNHYYIKYNGERFYSDTRQYFISRYDGNLPSGYLAHDQIDNNFLCLGSWYDENFPVLIVKK